jgi:beta-phosphoglucomutase-like phosphatase (HAD superfamily)
MIGRSHQLQGHCYEATRLQQVLKRRGISDDEETRHRHQPMQLEEHIKTLLDEQINLEADIKLKKASLQKAKKELKSVREKKKKIDMPLFSQIENLLKEYNISAAAYHSGKLNGVDCHELIQLAKPLFFQFE